MEARGTIGVGVGVIVVRDGKVLLGRRKGSHGAGTWSAPGGRLEFGESVEDCALRELREETGLSLGPVEVGPYTNDVFADVQEQYVTAFVIARHATGEPENLEPLKCDGWAWFPWDELPEPLFEPIRSLVASGYMARQTPG
ncbi:MAG: NUDIX domain-containing protein [Variovorax sp.]|nr:NUDIX domain-containing protein [Variovorax sp.]